MFALPQAHGQLAAQSAAAEMKRFLSKHHARLLEEPENVMREVMPAEFVWEISLGIGVVRSGRHS